MTSSKILFLFGCLMLSNVSFAGTAQPSADYQPGKPVAQMEKPFSAGTPSTPHEKEQPDTSEE